MRHIHKIGLACLRGGRILFVRKAGGVGLILPGGKPEAGEDASGTLRREILEELGCGLGPDLRLLGSFDASAVDMTDVRVTVEVHHGTLESEPRPKAEIAEIVWLDPRDGASAPSLVPHVLPLLLAAGLVSD